MESTRVNGGESGVGAKLAISIRAWLPGPKITPNNRNLSMTSSMSALISHFSSPPRLFPKGPRLFSISTSKRFCRRGFIHDYL